MNPTMLFHLFSISLFAHSALSVLVSDLKPDVNCLALMAQKAEERAKDPTIVSIIKNCFSVSIDMEIEHIIKYYYHQNNI